MHQVLSDSKCKLKNNEDYFTFFYQQSQVLLLFCFVLFLFLFLFLLDICLCTSYYLGLVLHFLHIHAYKILYVLNQLILDSVK